MRLATDTTDIGVQIPRLPRTILQAIHTRRRARLITTWYYSRLAESYIEQTLRRELSRNPAARRCDAVLTIHDLAVLPVPFFVYTDISWDGLATMIGIDESAALLSMTPSSVARRRERQLGIYQRATGIITMSRWLARSLVQQTGVPPGKVHVVPPGISQVGRPQTATSPPAHPMGGVAMNCALRCHNAPRRAAGCCSSGGGISAARAATSSSPRWLSCAASTTRGSR